MRDLSIKIKELEEKAGRLVERYLNLRSEYQLIKEDNLNLKETINKQKLLIQQLDERDKTKHTLQTLEHHKEDPIITKQIINEMMREIDKCLLLLDK